MNMIVFIRIEPTCQFKITFLYFLLGIGFISLGFGVDPFNVHDVTRFGGFGMSNNVGTTSTCHPSLDLPAACLSHLHYNSTCSIQSDWNTERAAVQICCTFSHGDLLDGHVSPPISPI